MNLEALGFTVKSEVVREKGVSAGHSFKRTETWLYLPNGDRYGLFDQAAQRVVEYDKKYAPKGKK